MKHPDVGPCHFRADPAISIKWLLLLFCISISTTLFSQEKGRDGLVPVNSTQSGTTRAVVVGISDYQHPDIPDLRFAHRDAEAFAEWLRYTSGKKLDGNKLHVLLNAEATASRILNEIVWLVEESEPGDEAIIFFSGHGDVQRAFGQDGYLLCNDASPQLYGAGGAISMHLLKEATTSLSTNKRTRIMLIVDACRAGKLTGSVLGGPQLTVQSMMRQFEQETKLLACQPNEVSLESSQWGEGNGVFSYFVIQGLSGGADEDENGTITLYEMKRYLEEHILQETAPILQHPTITGNPELVLARLPIEMAGTASTSKSFPNFQMIEQRSYEELLFHDADTSLLFLVNKFKNAIAREEFFSSTGASAETLYNQILKHPGLNEKANRYLTRYYAAALQDDAQRTLMNLLAVETRTVTAGQELLPKMQKFPQQIRRAAMLLGPKHIIYNDLLAREALFEGMALYLKTSEQTDSSSAAQVMAAYSRSLEFQSDSTLAYYGMSRCLAVKMNNPDSALTILHKLHELAPVWTLPGAVLAYELCENYGRFKDAVELIKRNLEIDSMCIPTNTALGALYHHLPNVSKAIMAFEYVVSLDSTNALAWSNLGAELMRKKDWINAKNAIQKAIRLNPSLTRGHHNLGALFLHQGKLSEAEACYITALHLSPNLLANLDSLASLYQLINKPDLALAFCDTMLSLQPQYASALFRKASIYLDMGAHETSFHFLTSALRIEPELIREIKKMPKWSRLTGIESLLKSESSKTSK